MDRASGFVFQVKGTFHTPKEDYDETNCYYDAATVLACTVGATGVWAAGPGRTGLQRACHTAQCLFTDENGDGVCGYHADGMPL